MKLQRFNVWVDTDGANTVDAESPRGEYYRAAEVDALLGDLRESVLEERRAAPPWTWRDCYFLGPLDADAGERRLADAKTVTDALLPAPLWLSTKDGE